MFIDCSKQQPTGDSPMRTTYELIDPSSTTSNTVYTRIQKPHNYENVNADVAVPVYSI